MTSIDCIIPFFNEADRIFSVVMVLTKIEEINQIICVDDGSEDNLSDIFKNKFVKVKLIKNSVNQGKSYAIESGLKFVASEDILLIDADIQNLIADEIRSAIETYSSKSLDMLILRSTNCPLITKISRHDIIFSGTRIVKKKLLVSAFKLKPGRYAIESALNKVCIQNNIQVRYTNYLGKDTVKSKKMGFLKAHFANLKMLTEILLFLNPVQYFRQVLFFCHKQL